MTQTASRYPTVPSRYTDFNVINAIADTACNDTERLMSELGIIARQQGKKYAGPCPIHGGDNPGAFNFYPDGEAVRGNWVCRTKRCHEKPGIKRNLPGLVQAVKSAQLERKFTWKETVDWLCRFNNQKLEDVKIPDEAMIAKRRLNQAIHKLNISPQQKQTGWSREWIRSKLVIPSEYYLNRGYSAAILDKYDVGYYADQNRVSVPVYDDNYKFCIGFTARTVNPQCKICKMYHTAEEGCPSLLDPLAIIKASKWRNSRDFEASNYLYNYWFARHHIAKNGGVAILVEGPGDVWRLEENGIHISMAMFGVELKEPQRVILDSSGCLSLIIMLDNDDAGREAAEKLKKKLGRTYRLFFPKFSKHDVGDLNSDLITKEIEPLMRKLGVFNG